MTVARTKILVDCDPGHDDAVAILFAARHFDLLAVTTVHGNAPIAGRVGAGMSAPSRPVLPWISEA